MSDLTYEDRNAGRTWPVSTPLWCAPGSGGVLHLPLGPGLTRQDIRSDVHSLWRYGKAIRINGEPSVCLGEGLTPLIELDWNGFSVHAKADHMMPTGSFKDRGASVLVNYLISCGVKAIADDTSGNLGASLASYAAAGGLSCRIYCPVSTPIEKLAQMRALGADVTTVPGPREAATDAAQAEENGHFYASHVLQPFFLEGTKTVAYELWEQFDFSVPDTVIAPLGQGGNVIGLYQGFSELIRSGAISRMPRIIGVQAAACAPFLHNGHSPFTSDTTIAGGISCAKPGRRDDVMEAINASNGTLIAVEESDIIKALHSFLSRGLYIEPTTAVTGAALSKLLEEGKIRDRLESVVILLTGHGLKTSETIRKLTEVAVK